MGRFIWLIGENLSETANNNAYFFWRNIVEIQDDIDKYYVLKKNKANIELYNELPESCRKYIIWRNSVEHFRLFFDSDMLFVAQSFRDVKPERIYGKGIDLTLKKPIIYLQHGTLSMKALGYKGWGYKNNFFRFVIYNKLIKQTFMEKNDFKEYQVYYNEFQPRYIELIRRFRERTPGKKRILWFMTWREYLGDNQDTQSLLWNIKKVITNPKLHEYLEKESAELILCVHKFFDEEKIKLIRGENPSDHIRIVHASDVDVMQELVDCDALITDYSSVGFDVTLLGKPVILYQPDLRQYLRKRPLYCTLKELGEYNLTSPKSLVRVLTTERYGVNQFFRSRMPETIDLDEILSGKFIRKMYGDFAKIQRNKITFVGYNFYGIGGTVFATRSLAEGLMEKGYMVELLSLKRTGTAKKPPYGLTFSSLYSSNSKDVLNLYKRHFYRRKKLYSHLVHDRDIDKLKPYAGYRLSRWMDETNSRIVISTRESLHLFLNDAKSDSIRKKVYFFHCAAELVEEIFPGIVSEIEKCDIGNAVFVTENNRQKYIEEYGYEGYDRYIVLGNCLESSRSVEREKIMPIPEKEVYRGIYLLRVSSERKADLENLIGYGCYLRDNEINDIVIDVYGTGDYVDEFVSRLEEEGLEEYICYRKSTKDGPAEIRKHDALVDFSLKNSFGMSYIEGVMNGKPVFCEHNQGSDEVMGRIPSAYIKSYEDLTEKLHSLKDISVEELQENYDIISEKYSRKALAERMLEFLDENELLSE